MSDAPAETARFSVSTEALKNSGALGRLSERQVKLLVALSETRGDRIAAVERALGLTGDSAKLVALEFGRGALADAIDECNGVTVDEKIMRAIDRAIRSRRTTIAQVKALALQAQLAGLIPAKAAPPAETPKTELTDEVRAEIDKQVRQGIAEAVQYQMNEIQDHGQIAKRR